MSHNTNPKTIVILASGSGTNAEAIIQYFSNSRDIQVSHIISNNPSAQVLKRAEKHGINSTVLYKNDFYASPKALDVLQKLNPDLIVLAGFLLKIPENIISSFPNRILNIHPALLPKYGGKGMYGNNIHHVVLQNRDTETGITIHYVNENYDEGQIIAQFKTPLDQNETLDSLLSKIRRLEHHHYPRIIEKLVMSIR